MRIVRVSSASSIKLDAVRSALLEAWPREAFEILPCPTELQDRKDVTFDAQPEGWGAIVTYLRARHEAMVAEYGPTELFDIDVESGAVDGFDVAGVLITTFLGEQFLLRSEGVPFPDGTLEEARRRGFKKTTAGDIIHEWNEDIPANNWQSHYWPYTSRKTQIYRVLVRGFDTLPEL